MSHLALLFQMPDILGSRRAQGLLLYLIFLVGINDVLQFGAKPWPARRAPKVSPNKTWEGLVGGVLSVSPSQWTPLLDAARTVASRPDWLLCGRHGLHGRRHRVRHQTRPRHQKLGNAIPGHGGYLDRLDGFSAAAAPFFHLVYFFSVTSAA